MSRRLWTVAFLSVPLLAYTTIVIVPLVTSFYYSLTDWNGFSAQYHWVGFANFARIASDPLFANAIKNTAIWMAAAIVVPTAAGLALALVLHRGVRGAKLFKSLFYLPICLALAVVGQVWIWIYRPDWGLLDLVLRDIGFSNVAIAWLADSTTALGAIILAWSWQQTGLAMVIFLAGLTAVSRELTEAAEIDGASYGQSLRRVVIPLLSPATVVVVALSILNSLKSFDAVYVMTKGGPFHSSDTLAMFMYDVSFESYYMGYGSAISVVLFLVAMIVITFYFRQVRALEHLHE